MNALRTLLLALMALSMVLTSGPMALARTAPGGETIIICTGMGLSTITLDADGNEVDPSPICPDCVVHNVAVLGVAMRVTGAAMTFSMLQSAHYAPETLSFEAVQAAARGPPLAL